jgi:ribosomal protein S18 acetylase RimI-like enzyme
MALPRQAREPADVEAVRELFKEYVHGVDEPCCFRDFERELADLPHGYFMLLLAREEGLPAGCVALREIDPSTAEMKRLYVRPAYQGRGVGRSLAAAAVAAARRAGYERVVLDTLPKMREALALYRSLEFRAIPPYLAEPTPGASCFELKL